LKLSLDEITLALPARFAPVAVLVLDFFFWVRLAAMGLRYHPASGRKIAHPIEGMFQLMRELRRVSAAAVTHRFRLLFEDL
jgi:hypothetical protein